MDQQTTAPAVFDKMHEVQLLQGVRRMVVDIRCQLPFMSPDTKSRLTTEFVSLMQEILNDVPTQES